MLNSNLITLINQTKSQGSNKNNLPEIIAINNYNNYN